MDYKHKNLNLHETTEALGFMGSLFHYNNLKGIFKRIFCRETFLFQKFTLLHLVGILKIQYIGSDVADIPLKITYFVFHFLKNKEPTKREVISSF